MDRPVPLPVPAQECKDKRKPAASGKSRTRSPEGLETLSTLRTVVVRLTAVREYLAISLLGRSGCRAEVVVSEPMGRSPK